VRISYGKGKTLPAFGIFLTLALFALERGELISSYVLFIVMVGMCNAILTLGLNLITGITGQFSLGHAGFMALGAYLSAYLSKVTFALTPSPDPRTWCLFAVCLLLGGLFAAVTAYLLGLIFLRLTGDYLCIATLGFTQIVVVALNNLMIVGGPRGFYGIPKLSNFTVIALCAWGTVFLLSHYMQSSKGRVCQSVLEDEIAAESLGIDVFKVKLHSFTLGCFFAGVGGALLAHLVQLAHPTQYSFIKSIDILLMMVVGGMGSIKGSVIAAILLTILPEALRFSQDLRLIVYPLLLIVMISKDPGQWIRRALNEIPGFPARSQS
jgi:branched-chain amino acid transport system permease protein